MSVSFMALLLNSAFIMLRLGSPVNSFPRPLPAAEEAEYVRRSLSGDIEARNLLIEHNLRLVAHIIKKYYTQDCDQDDLISIGTIGLIKGISSYKPDKGVRLATYASRCVENEILMYFRSRKKTAGDVSLSEAIEAGEDGGELSFMDVLCREDNMLERITSAESRRRLRGYIETELTPREAEIIKMRYGLYGAPARTQRETAEAMRISRSYVSRIEKKALEKLEAAFLRDG
ncbi:MAG: RNA polymerase sporulation sigma factor SigK [Oscillospiraceae bacterium]|nr:RNA polymerase sporulation sigma factor SigK [Oscillospiraceae bacterium]